jgi:outer membrane protein OmpA-like peptidoglycan-associated protein
MYRKGLLIVLAGALAGCASSPPAPPAPDESTRRPVNSNLGIELQGCQANLANTRLALDETARNAERTGSAMAQLAAHCDRSPGGLAAPGASATASGRANTVYVLFFGYAQREIRLSEDDVNRLVVDARSASGIQVRGRTDATRDNAYDNALAAGRANAVFSLLVGHGVDPAKIRLTYQGFGDTISPNTDEKTRALNRRAEIEIYRLPPEVVIFANRDAQ